MNKTLVKKWVFRTLKIVLAFYLLLTLIVVYENCQNSSGIVGNTISIPSQNHSPTMPITHIIFMVKENRAFDNYFGLFPGANGTTQGTVHTGQVIPLFPATDSTFDVDHVSADAQ